MGSQWFINPNFNSNSEVEQSACSADLQSAVSAGLQPAGHPVMRADQKSAWHLRVENPRNSRLQACATTALRLADTGNFGVWGQSGRMHHDPQFCKSQRPTLAALHTAGSRYASFGKVGAASGCRPARPALVAGRDQLLQRWSSLMLGPPAALPTRCHSGRF